MIYSICHAGSGLGNQLHRIIAGKVLALDRGLEHKVIALGNFKGKSFMDLNAEDAYLPYITEPGSGKVICQAKFPLWEEKTQNYNPEINFVDDWTIIDGEFQDDKYFGHRMKEIDEWLKVEPIEIPDDVCVIGFRGGEYKVFPELYLPKEYWDLAIKMMKEINPDMKFEVHTDDPESASEVIIPLMGNLSITKVVHDIGLNWRSIRYAKYAIIANSSFFIFPRLLNGGVTIAPRGWARRNIGEWSRPDNYYRQFKYI